MGFRTGIVMLLLTVASVSATQELLRMNVSSKVTVACGQTVTLRCQVSSSREGLVVTQLRWSQNKTSLCDVNSLGEVTHHSSHTQRQFWCLSKHNNLSLTFQQVRPMDSGEVLYMCTVHSNHGILKGKATLELQECYRDVRVRASSRVATCHFTGVHPGGEVHWFRGSVRVSGAETRQNVEAGGWLNITSTLEKGNDGGPYSCSLWNPESEQYITKEPVVIPEPDSDVRTGAQVTLFNGADAQGPPWRLVAALLIAASMVK